MSFSKNYTNTKSPSMNIGRPGDTLSASIDAVDQSFGANREPTTVEAIPVLSANNNVPPPSIQNEIMEREDCPKAVVAASAAAGGILGCLIGGIGCAIIGGLGTAYAAKHKEGTCIGDCARAMGDVALTAREKAVALDQKHHIVNYTQTAASGALENAKAMDEEYHVAEKGKNCLLHTGKAAMDFASRHKLVERGVSGVGRGMSYLGGRVAGSATTNSDSSSNSESISYLPVSTTMKSGY